MGTQVQDGRQAPQYPPTRRRLVHELGVIGSGCAVVVGVSLASAPVSFASSAPAAASTNICNWNPSADSHRSASFVGGGNRIHTGPSTSCTAVGEGFANQHVYARCYTVEPPRPGITWYYVTDTSTGVTGWVIASNINVPVRPAIC